MYSLLTLWNWSQSCVQNIGEELKFPHRNWMHSSPLLYYYYLGNFYRASFTKWRVIRGENMQTRALMSKMRRADVCIYIYIEVFMIALFLRSIIDYFRGWFNFSTLFHIYISYDTHTHIYFHHQHTTLKHLYTHIHTHIF